jgi:SpoVK/Ycf46/Vps4 family AAA+-type ATPase
MTPTTRLSRFGSSLAELVRARFPLLYVHSGEEDRLLYEVVSLQQQWTSFPAPGGRPPRPLEVYQWSTARGLGRIVHGGFEPIGPGGADPVVMLTTVEGLAGPAVVLVCDLHWQLQAQRPADQHIVRRLREMAVTLPRKPDPVSVLLTSPVLEVPDELRHEVHIIDLPLPDRDTIQQMLQAIGREQASPIDVAADTQARLVDAALGLTLRQARQAFKLALVRFDGKLDQQAIDLVQAEKGQAVRRSGILELVQHRGGLEQVGGLAALKDWLRKRDGSWLPAGQDFGLAVPRGVLILGVPGCGKSLTAKCVSATWRLPLVRLDLGRVFAGLVGRSEHNMRAALRTAEALAPCVLWIDELEKAFGQIREGGNDGGVSRRIFGTFLTWMQEKEAMVFVMATANEVRALPAEFLRKGRFDEIFFVDLPDATERREIFSLQLQRRRDRNPTGTALTHVAALERDLHGLVEATPGFTGAEIEQVVESAMFAAYVDGQRPLFMADLLSAVAATRPLAVTAREQIADLRQWADTRAVAASTAKVTP